MLLDFAKKCTDDETFNIILLVDAKHQNLKVVAASFHKICHRAALLHTAPYCLVTSKKFTFLPYKSVRPLGACRGFGLQPGGSAPPRPAVRRHQNYGQAQLAHRKRLLRQRELDGKIAPRRPMRRRRGHAIDAPCPIRGRRGKRRALPMLAPGTQSPSRWNLLANHSNPRQHRAVIR